MNTAIGSPKANHLSSTSDIQVVLGRLDGWRRLAADELLNSFKPLEARQKAYRSLMGAPVNPAARVSADEAEAISIVLARSGLHKEVNLGVLAGMTAFPEKK